MRLWQLTHIKYMMFNKIHWIFFLLQEQCFLVLKILHLIVSCNLPVSKRSNLYYALCYLCTVFGVSLIVYYTTKAFWFLKWHSVSAGIQYNSSGVLAPGDKLQRDVNCGHQKAELVSTICHHRLLDHRGSHWKWMGNTAAPTVTPTIVKQNKQIYFFLFSQLTLELLYKSNITLEVVLLPWISSPV